MKKLIALFLFLCVGFANAQTWVSSTQTFTALDNSKAPIAVFVNSYTGAGVGANIWQTIDLKPFGVAADAKSAFLSGILIITHGMTIETCDLTVAVRAPGSVFSAGNYIGQTIETQVASGQRSNMSTWVPLVNGSFQFQWNRSTMGDWPDQCSYGINLSLQAWVK